MLNWILAITISLLTCSPGEELYARYGHTAIRVCDTSKDIDWVFNYGLFSFEDSGFYWHFVQGQTWYQLGVQSYAGFAAEYAYEKRVVNEQVLDLSEDESKALVQALLINAQPQNCKYLYNFVFDNCATRPYHLLMRVLGDTIASSYVGWEGKTYREFIHHYTRHGSWAEFGIDLVFGWKADQHITGEQRLFLPEELMLWFSEARRMDGRRLVRSEQLTPFVIQSVPWYATWYFGIAVLAIALLILSLYDKLRGKRTKWVDWVLYGIYMLLGILLIFLIFFSIHPLVSIGWRLFLIPLIHVCTRLIYYWR